MKQINSHLNHLLYFIQDFDKNIGIYKKMFEYLGYDVLMDEDYGFGVKSPNKASIWFMAATEKNANHRDANGLNHLGIGVDSEADVDKFTNEFLKVNNIECLFDTPKARPDFTGEAGTYYQVMFELPGSLLFEVVYTTF